MFNSKYSNVLTAILIIVILAILVLLGFVGYDFYKKYYIDKDATEFVDKYEGEINSTEKEENVIENNVVEGTVTNPLDNLNQTNNNQSGGSSSGNKKYTYKGFNVVGTIEIPKTGIKYPILSEVTPKSIEVAVAMLYGPGPNEVGNTVIIGHNYRSGAFFGKNKQLAKGDIIYITDNNGRKIKYTIYNIITVLAEDSDYMARNTNGAREISLSTCTDDSKKRLVIWARE